MKKQKKLKKEASVPSTECVRDKLDSCCPVGYDPEAYDFGEPKYKRGPYEGFDPSDTARLDWMLNSARVSGGGVSFELKVLIPVSSESLRSAVDAAIQQEHIS